MPVTIPGIESANAANGHPMFLRGKSLITTLTTSSAILLFFITGANAESEHELNGKATALVSYNDAISGASGAGLSRLVDEDNLGLAAKLQLSYEYSNDNLGFFSHMQLTTEANGRRGDVGMVQMYGYYHYEIDEHDSLMFSAGQFFMPTSMENSENFWDSPYSNNFSALNSWIAQEIRPVGLEIRYDHISDEDQPFSAFGFGAMSFINNDSMGTQLTWRGWSIGRHKTAYGEVLPLPSIHQIEAGYFAHQRDDGGKPFDRDLDHQYGYLFHSYWSPSEALTLKLSYLDNGGDSKLHHGEYAWTTTAAIAGVLWQVDEHWTLLAETMWGYSAMGNPPVVGVDTHYDTTYLLANYQHQQWDYSLRLEWFAATDQAVKPAESNDKGRALTLSTRWRAFGKPWSVIGEWLMIDAQDNRDRRLANGTFDDKNESHLSVSLNYEF